MIVDVQAASLGLVSYVDAINVERVRYESPEIRITQSGEDADDVGVQISSGISEVDFGIAPYGTVVEREFVIENLGDQDLVVNLNREESGEEKKGPYRRDSVTGALLDAVTSLSIPNGYDVKFLDGEQIGPGESTRMVVTLSASDPGVYDGTLAIETNDVDESIFRIDSVSYTHLTLPTICSV